MNSTITIVTPSLNQGRYIKQTIRSIWSQAGDFSIEHFILDGGSTDETIAVIKKMEKTLKNGSFPIKNRGIKLFWQSKPDNGQAEALNFGFKKASGDIMAWLNSDDFYEPGTLQKVWMHFKKHPEDELIYGDMNFVNNKGALIKKCDYLIDFNFWRLQNSCYICQPSTFFKKTVYDKVGPLDNTYHYVFDYDFWLRSAMAGINLKRVHFGVLANLRKHPASKTVSGPIKQRRETIRMLIKNKLYFNYNYLISLWVIFKETLRKLFT